MIMTEELNFLEQSLATNQKQLREARAQVTMRENAVKEAILGLVLFYKGKKFRFKKDDRTIKVLDVFTDAQRLFPLSMWNVDCLTIPTTGMPTLYFQMADVMTGFEETRDWGWFNAIQKEMVQ
jgi:hypothetical protein